MKINEHGAEYWSARELQVHLGYTKWANFDKAIKKAVTSCEQSGNDPANHFAGAGNMVTLGSRAQRTLTDHHLSRFACYLIAQNGDPRKAEIALAQKYFAIQTRRQELSDQNAADIDRLELREQAKHEFKARSGAASAAGVQSRMFGVFHDAGCKGMYGGLGKDQIKARKGIDAKHDLMDRMDTTELAANNFRFTQTRDKLEREGVNRQERAIQVHNEVGREVRHAIRKIGGTMPEDIKPAEHIKKVAKRVKQAVPKLEGKPDCSLKLTDQAQAETPSDPFDDL